MAVGKSIVTVDGINALAKASASGNSVRPKYFKFSNQELVLDPYLGAEDINGWITKDINLYQIIHKDTVEFVCDVAPDEAADYTRVCGLYLEDGTLFMVAKPPFPFPPGLRQTFKIQMVYQEAAELLDFKYVPFSEEEQSFSILDTSLTFGLESIQRAENEALDRKKLLEVANDVIGLKVDDLEAKKRLDSIEKSAKENRLSQLDSSLFLSLEIFKNANEIGLIKSKIGG